MQFVMLGYTIKPKSVIRLLRDKLLSYWHLFHHFSVTMEPHCAFKAPKHLFKNSNYYRHNANDRFGFNRSDPKKSFF